ncbi:MAG: hypothetical protein FWB83_01775 [Treponema sp.]|nr:hypothetical protein [Treponema sp.]
MNRINGLLIIFSLYIVSSCALPSSDEAGGGVTDVVYSPDGRSLTIYLEGSAPESSRALTSGMAKMTHDFFEVVFDYFDGTQNYTARASWELGHVTGISGVYRNDAGVDYGTVDGSAAGVTAGKAVIFVGTKVDYTLLGIGRLVAVDGIAGTIIDSSTRTITFEVAALEAGVSFDASESSFLTANTDDLNDALSINTNIVSVTFIGNDSGSDVEKDFPVFLIPAGASEIAARYTINVVGGAINNYFNAVKVKDTGGTAERNAAARTGFREGGQYWLVDDSKLNNNDVSVTMINNTGGNFENEIDFLFSNIVTTDELFSFSFKIPVYAIADGGEVPWFIRPGIIPFAYDFDDGNGNSGGSILIYTGTDPGNITVNFADNT